MKTYDLVVIGSGGAANIAQCAYEAGLKVALIEEAKMGGTCLNRGCIPSKMLIHPANVATSIKESHKLGFESSLRIVHFKKILERINKETDTDSSRISSWYKTTKDIGYYQGHARFLSDHVIDVQNEIFFGKIIVIGTGARPSIPPISGLLATPYWTSTQALRSHSLPKRLIVIGGGYIACELGYAYAALGCDVHFLVRDHQLLTREDNEISQQFTKIFSKNHSLYFDVSTEKVEYTHKKFRVTIKDKNKKIKRIDSDALLVATGIAPNADKLGLENTSIKTNNRGFIKVNQFLQTKAKNVYALGDVVGNYLFRHSVNFEADYLCNLLVREKKKPISYPPIPHAVFTHPEIAAVGKTQEELHEEKIPYIIGRCKYSETAMGLARHSDQDFVKLLFHRKTKRLLGAHIMGEEASILIHQLIYAITLQATVADLLKMVYVHPALSEVVMRAAYDAAQKLG